MISLRDKSLGSSFINLTYFNFACGDENPLKFVNLRKYYDHDCSLHKLNEGNSLQNIYARIDKSQNNHKSRFSIAFIFIVVTTSDFFCDFQLNVTVGNHYVGYIYENIYTEINLKDFDSTLGFLYFVANFLRFYQCDSISLPNCFLVLLLTV